MNYEIIFKVKCTIFQIDHGTINTLIVFGKNLNLLFTYIHIYNFAVCNFFNYFDLKYLVFLLKLKDSPRLPELFSFQTYLRMIDQGLQFGNVVRFIVILQCTNQQSLSNKGVLIKHHCLFQTLIAFIECQLSTTGL